MVAQPVALLKNNFSTLGSSATAQIKSLLQISKFVLFIIITSSIAEGNSRYFRALIDVKLIFESINNLFSMYLMDSIPWRVVKFSFS